MWRRSGRKPDPHGKKPGLKQNLKQLLNSWPLLTASPRPLPCYPAPMAQSMDASNRGHSLSRQVHKVDGQPTGIVVAPSTILLKQMRGYLY
jgi:hypothetical protein